MLIASFDGHFACLSALHVVDVAPIGLKPLGRGVISRYHYARGAEG
jgi:hypothetical protein